MPYVVILRDSIDTLVDASVTIQPGSPLQIP